MAQYLFTVKPLNYQLYSALIKQWNKIKFPFNWLKTIEIINTILYNIVLFNYMVTEIKTLN